MTTSTTDAEAIRNALGVLRIKWRGHDDARIDDASIDEAVAAILSYLASRRETQEPVAWRVTYADGDTVYLHHKPTGDSGVYECTPLYTAPPSPAPAGEVERLGPEETLSAEILAELTRARAKFPGKNVTFAALVEEVGELATATFEEGRDRVRKEAVQVAVMAMRMVLDGDHTFDDWRASKGLDCLVPAALNGGRDDD